jgi:hypothetical protein
VTRLVLAVMLALTGVAAAQPVIDDAPTQREPGAQPPSNVDKRPFYVGAGVVVLAALMLWNRRHRAALERRSEDETRRIREAARARRAGAADADADADVGPDADDPDAADLAAAAAKSPDQEPS